MSVVALVLAIVELEHIFDDRYRSTSVRLPIALLRALEAEAPLYLPPKQMDAFKARLRAGKEPFLSLLDIQVYSGSETVIIFDREEGESHGE
jgi:hypothetical protein